MFASPLPSPLMRYETFVALRYLSASRRAAHVALISTISVLGLGVGVAALVISLSLLSGFQDRIRSQMAVRSPHLVVSPSRGPILADPDRVRSVLERDPAVIALAPAIEGRGWLSDEQGRTTLPIRYRNASSADVEGGPEDDLPRARLTASLAARTGSGVGDVVRITSSRTRLSPIGPLPVSLLFRVSSVLRSGALEKVPDAEVGEDAARTLSGIASGARSFEARLSDPAGADEAAGRVSSKLGPGVLVQTWRELNAPLSFALRLEKAVIFATVALVIVVAALNVVSNIALLVVEKKRDLGVFTAMGAAPASLSRIYFALGGAIGSLGTAAGIVVGVGASLLLDRFRAIPLPADVYLLSHVPFAVHPREVALVAFFALATALGAAVLPARAAARLAPGEAVRLSR